MILYSYLRTSLFYYFIMMVGQVSGMNLSGPSGLSMLVCRGKLNGNFSVIPQSLDIM